MNDEAKKPVPGPIPTGDGHAGSGKGADTALEALIRKRKLAETPDADHPKDLPPPTPPLLPLPPA
jgi:hypothetical protein